jgi:REP element-mobilizing transposase RayT
MTENNRRALALNGAAMSYVRVWVHAVWGTKNREHFLTREIRPVVIKHILENARKKEIFIDRLNGYTDHLHCLFGLNADMTIAKALQLLKGESAFWINKEKLLRGRFEWADEYFAVSISESMLDNVHAYVDYQEEHHRKLSFTEEVEQLMQNYKLERHG